MVLQRRLASSLRAIRTSLARREEKLKDKLLAMRTGGITPPTPPVPSFEDEPEDDEERWEQEDAALGVTLSIRSVKEMELEIQEVHELYELACMAEEEAERTDCERKLAELRKLLREPLEDGKTVWESGEKLLVFTENRDTLDYLVEKFMTWGFRVAQIYGGMKQEDRRAAQDYFKEPEGAQILVATEAAGEGINLQFCRLMVNYDIPWNPNRLEQRMGRIHRYGQKYSVRVFNLVASNTREGNVLDKVLEKLVQMRRDLGVENVYDIIGDLLSAADLTTLVERAIKERQSLEDIRAAVTHTVDANEQRRRIQSALVTALAADAMSPAALEGIREQLRTANEQRLVPEYVERFVVTAFRSLCRDSGLRADIRPRTNEPGAWSIESVPHFIRLVATQTGHSIQPSYSHIVFSKALLEKYPKAAFVSPGHPLFDALLTLVRGKYGEFLTQGARFAAPPAEQGLFWLLEATVKDGTGTIAGQKLVGIYQSQDGTLTARDPLTLLDFEPIPSAAEGSGVPALPTAQQAQAAAPKVIESWCRDEIIDPYLESLRQRRQHEANLREEYLQRSMQTLIAEQSAKIISYTFNDGARRRDAGQYDIGLRTLEQGLEEYESRLRNRMEESTADAGAGCRHAAHCWHLRLRARPRGSRGGRRGRRPGR